MKKIILLALVQLSVFAQATSLMPPGNCIDPRVVRVQCKPGTVFVGWIKGECDGILVKGPNCKSLQSTFPRVAECYDPRVALVKCAEGTEFKGWNYGDCTGGLVKGPVCE